MVMIVAAFPFRFNSRSFDQPTASILIALRRLKDDEYPATPLVHFLIPNCLLRACTYR